MGRASLSTCAALKLDTHVEASGRSPGNRNLLDIEDNFFVGAVPTDKAVHDKIGCETGFVSCIYSIKVGKRYLSLSDPDVNDIVAAFEIGECSKKSMHGFYRACTELTISILFPEQCQTQMTNEVSERLPTGLIQK